MSLVQEPAASMAAERVGAVQRRAADRYVLAGEFYRAAARRRYGRAELSFLRWEIGRGVLNVPGADPPGSPWWRAINDRLLRDKVEADLLHRDLPGRPSAPSVELWRAFIDAPSPASWYRAHNASIVAGYLENLPLAEAELPAERFMMNVALVRVLYAHALVAAPKLALGVFAAAGPPLADPRHGSVGLFLDLRRSFADRYPLSGLPVEDMIAAEAHLPRALDLGIIAPRITKLYDFAAVSLGLPQVGSLIVDGTPCYAWPAALRSVWFGGTAGAAPRLAHRLLGVATRPRPPGVTVLR